MHVGRKQDKSFPSDLTNTPAFAVLPLVNCFELFQLQYDVVLQIEKKILRDPNKMRQVKSHPQSPDCT
jgi:hypothetical protein